MKPKTLSIIIPVYNEEKYIAKTLERVISANSFGLKKEIIVVDDGSSDETASKLKVKSEKLKIKIIRRKRNEGKGKALKAGFLASTGDIVLVQDADLEYDPTDYPLLLEPFLKNDADVVYGSRFITHRPHRVLYFWHYVGNQIMTIVSNMLTNLNFTDVYCGYKVFRGEIIRNIAKKITSRGFEVEAELTSLISKEPNLKIYEVGVSYFGRTFEEGKKIRPIDAVKGAIKLIQTKLWYNY